MAFSNKAGRSPKPPNDKPQSEQLRRQGPAAPYTIATYRRTVTYRAQLMNAARYGSPVWRCEHEHGSAAEAVHCAKEERARRTLATARELLTSA